MRVSDRVRVFRVIFARVRYFASQFARGCKGGAYGRECANYLLEHAPRVDLFAHVC
jgi:hypothetical protein